MECSGLWCVLPYLLHLSDHPSVDLSTLLLRVGGWSSSATLSSEEWCGRMSVWGCRCTYLCDWCKALAIHTLYGMDNVFGILNTLSSHHTLYAHMHAPHTHTHTHTHHIHTYHCAPHTVGKNGLTMFICWSVS